MKEKIYTIPVTEAFGQDCECPICVLESELEKKAISFVLGPSLMEPDKRDDTTEKGFCRRHFEMLFNERENALGLALVVHSHLEYITKTIKSYAGKSDKPKKKKRLLKSKGGSQGLKTTTFLASITKTCEICDRIDSTMDRFIEVITYLYFREEEFRNVYKQNKGFCLPHLLLLLKSVPNHLSGDKAEVFTEQTIQNQIVNMERLDDELDWFIKKFDYRFQNEPWKNSQDALPRTIEKLGKYQDLD